VFSEGRPATVPLFPDQKPEIIRSEPRRARRGGRLALLDNGGKKGAFPVLQDVHPDR
jgi:hypothetical protein